MSKQAQWVRSTLVLGVTIGLLAYLLTLVDLTSVLAVLSKAPPWRLACISILSLLAYATLPTWRWQTTLAAMNHRVSWGSLLLARWGGQPLKTIIPFKGGEAFRALWLQRQHHIEVVDGAASILFDMFLVAIAQLFFLAWGLSMASSELQQGVIPALLLLALGAGLASRTAQRLAVRVATSLHQRLGHLAERLAHGFLRFPLRTRMRLFAISLVVELSEIVSMWFCCWALGVDVPMAAVLLGMPIVMGFTLLPVTLSGFGTRELAIVYLFQSYGTKEELVASALLFTSIEFLLPTLLGLVLMPRFLARLSP